MAESQNSEDKFISHLIELRTRLIRAVTGLLVICILLFIWPGADAIYNFLAQPMINVLPQGSKMIATGVITPFLIPMKLTVFVAFVIALPWILYQIWAFVAPGLYSHEKKLVAPLIISSSALFIIGIAFCYFFVFGRVFKFISELAPTSIMLAPDIENYFDFVMTLCMAFGGAFEVPIVVVILVRMGIVSIKKLRAARPYMIVGAFVIAAIVTPPDIMSQLSLAIPLCLLFEMGLLVAPLFTRLTQTPQDDVQEQEIQQ